MMLMFQAKLIQRHLTILQMMRYVGIHNQASLLQRLEFVAELGRHYDAGLQLGLFVVGLLTSKALKPNGC